MCMHDDVFGVLHYKDPPTNPPTDAAAGALVYAVCVQI